jgi:TonB-linked SusC/RagA family outer membrane protein
MKKQLSLFLFILFAVQTIMAQDNWQVSGVVTDAEDGLPLPGVTVSVLGLTQGGITGLEGEFSLSLPKGKSLRFTYVGYKTQTVTIKGNEVLNIQMETDTHLLEEVVAIGYGSIKKSDLTGAVGSVSGDQLRMVPVSGVDQALQGRLAGVTVNANSGQPGARADVRIRGIGTVLSDASPLFVVDGVMVGNIDFLSPSDIQSTEVLKDASSTAIYGSKGANGVILITTKKGSAGKSNVTYETYLGWQNRWKKLDLMDRDQFAYYRSYLESYYMDQEIDPNLQQYFDTGDHNFFNSWVDDKMIGGIYFPLAQTATQPTGFDYAAVNTDWQDEVFVPNAFMQNHYLAVDGGTDKSTYAISGNFFNQDGMLIGSWYKRLTLRANSAHKVTDWLRVGENLAYSNSSNRNAANNEINTGVLASAVMMAPWDPVRYPEGSISASGRDPEGVRYPNGRDLSGQLSSSSNFSYVYNPFTSLETSFPKDKWERWVGDVYVELMPVKGLTLRGDVSLDVSNGENSNSKLKYIYSSYDKNLNKFYSAQMRKYRTNIYEATANYTNTFAKHSLNVVFGATREDYYYHTINGSGMPLDFLKIEDWTLGNLEPYNPANESTKIGAGENYDANRRISFLGRAHYVYDDKYLMTFSFRRDGSSIFPPDKKWGNFPSVALAWRISNESFYEPVKNAINMLKLRVGWGQIGNDKVGNLSFTNTLGSNSDVFYAYPLGVNQLPVTGAGIMNYAAPGKWEVSEQWNVGVDFTTAKGKLYGNIDAFVRDTKDMLLSTPAPGSVGYRTDITANVGTLRNQGIELMLEYRNKISNLNYSVSGNASIIKNELTKLNHGEKVFSGNGYQLSDEGLPVSTFWGYKYEGIFQTAEEIDNYYSYITDPAVLDEVHKRWGVGNAIYADLNKDGKIDDQDKTDLGNPFPWLTYGFNIGLDYKGFDLQMFFQGIYGNEIMNAMRQQRTENTGLVGVLSKDMTNMWTAKNPAGTIPNPVIQGNMEYSSRFIEDGAYFRLKNIQLGYSLPKQLLQSLRILQNMRVYVAASNLFTLTGYKGYDPEVGITGVDYGNYPQAKTFTVGAKINF